MLEPIKNKVMTLLQFILVFIYIIFEEIIWEGFAKPIYEMIHSLEILKKLDEKLKKVDANIILGIFVFLLLIVEVAGIYAGMLFVSGHVFVGLLVYLFKIPIAAFTFWLFRVTEDKLMQFPWFKNLYEKLLAGISWLKSRQTYIKTIARMEELKVLIKAKTSEIKVKHFSEESPFMIKIKKIYKDIKSSIQK